MSKQYRPTIDEYFIVMAMHAATRASCVRRRVGCVLVNDMNFVLATGMNGPPRGEVNCTTAPCAGAGCKSGESLDACSAIHGEINALLQCRDVQEISTAYVTTSPCRECIKTLLNTSCQRIVYLSKYADGHDSGIARWRKNGRIIESISQCDHDPAFVKTFCDLYGMDYS